MVSRQYVILPSDTCPLRRPCYDMLSYYYVMITLYGSDRVIRVLELCNWLIARMGNYPRITVL